MPHAGKRGGGGIGSSRGPGLGDRGGDGLTPEQIEARRKRREVRRRATLLAEEIRLNADAKAAALAAEAERKKIRRRKGRASTILTAPSPTANQQTLLG